MEKIGLDWPALSEANPRLVYCQITGFGRTGPLANQGGFDLIAQGYSGLMSITGEGAGRAPVKVGAPVTDITAGILAAFAVASALVRRSTTGEGMLVDTSLFEAGVTHTYWQSAIALASGVSPGPLGSGHPLTAPYQAFETADGFVNVGASNERTWSGLVGALGVPSLRDDTRFETNADRMANLDALVAEMAPIMKSDTSVGWLARLAEAGVPAGPIASVGEMLEHPQSHARDLVIEVEHARLGAVRSLGSPIKAQARDGEVVAGPTRRGAPLLGEHTREVLGESGFSADEIDAFLASEVLRTAD